MVNVLLHNSELGVRLTERVGVRTTYRIEILGDDGWSITESYGYKQDAIDSFFEVADEIGEKLNELMYSYK